MRYFFIDLAIGVFLAVLLLILFFKAGKKNKKQRRADRELVQNCGDEGLIRLYEQAESDNERDGILEFVKEKLASLDSGSAGSVDILPAGSLNPEEQHTAAPEAMPETSADAMPEAQPQQLYEMMPQTPPDSPPAAGRRTITGLVAGSGEEEREAEVTPAPAPARDGHLQTRELPLDKVDWVALEEELQKKREEEARIMAHNQLIQDVFSKIQGVEARVVGEKQENENQQTLNK